MHLANQALLSSAELIKCVERGVRTLRSDEQLMDCLYDDELTISENLPILMAASRQARPVSAAIANLYLHKNLFQFFRLSTHSAEKRLISACRFWLRLLFPRSPATGRF